MLQNPRRQDGAGRLKIFVAWSPPCFFGGAQKFSTSEARRWSAPSVPAESCLGDFAIIYYYF